MQHLHLQFVPLFFLPRLPYRRNLIKTERFAEAERVWVNILHYAKKWARLTTVYNYINDTVVIEEAPWENFLRNPVTKRALHVGNQPFDVINAVAHKKMMNDIMQSAKPTVEALLNWGAYDVVVYSGQLDIICAYPLTLNVFQKLNWKGAEAYRKADRCFFEMDGNVVGYTKSAGVFTEVLFRGCGHMVPTDCPRVASRFLDLFINDRKKMRCLREAGETSQSGSSQSGRSDTKILTKSENVDI
ncbi:vitellogenic carboxypeptidase-like [Bemisia tabaci]|uniref:vitellogenic carboxypeptidase-like n=1 Tax=Bemisia tabaci TaxID=7038 RepID=UPI003B281178